MNPRPRTLGRMVAVAATMVCAAGLGLGLLDVVRPGLPRAAAATNAGAAMVVSQPVPR